MAKKSALAAFGGGVHHCPFHVIRTGRAPFSDYMQRGVSAFGSDRDTETLMSQKVRKKFFSAKSHHKVLKPGENLC